MAITALAMLVGIGLLVVFALAAARRHPHRAGPRGGTGSNASDVSWMSGVAFDGGSSADGGASDCGSAGDGGGCDGGGGGE